MRKAVFLDRDGVLVKAKPVGNYAWGPTALEDFALLPGIAEPVARLRSAGYLAILVTNQPSVARGVMTVETLDQMHAILTAAVPLDAIRYCPHQDADGCACRKPKPGMLLDAVREFEIDLALSWMIGDTGRDVEAGAAAGVRTILLDTEYNRDYPAPLRADSLEGAAAIILE